MARKRKTDGRTPRRALWARTLIAITACGVAVGGLAAYRSHSDGSATAAERPVTTEEASRLALSRLNLYQASPVAVTLTAAEGGGVVVRVKGVVDYRAHRAVGSYQVTGSTESSGALGPPVTGQLDHGLIVWDAAWPRPGPRARGRQRTALAAGRADPALGLVLALLHERSSGRRAPVADRARC